MICLIPIIRTSSPQSSVELDNALRYFIIFFEICLTIIVCNNIDNRINVLLGIIIGIICIMFFMLLISSLLLALMVLTCFSKVNCLPYHLHHSHSYHHSYYPIIFHSQSLPYSIPLITFRFPFLPS